MRKQALSLIDVQLYEGGARNFLFMNVPPVDRAPLSVSLNNTRTGDMAGWIGRFSYRLGSFAQNFSKATMMLRSFNSTLITFSLRCLTTHNNFLRQLGTAIRRPTMMLTCSGYCLAPVSGQINKWSWPTIAAPVVECILMTLCAVYPSTNTYG